MKLICLEKSDSYSEYKDEQINEITFEVEGVRYLWYKWNGKWEECYVTNLMTNQVVDMGMETNVDDLEGVFQVFKHLMNREDDGFWQEIQQGYVIDTSKFDVSDYRIDPFKIEGAIIKQ
jgi:hypothetical protein